MPHTRSVSICIFLSVGSRYETKAEAGISHFIEHILFKGTEKRPTSREISEAIEGMGGILNGGTDKEITLYWCKVAQPHFLTALNVLADMLLHSRFNPEEIEKERQVIIEEINMSRDYPAQQAEMLIDELLWPDHPLGRDIAGSKESVTAITGNKMLDYLNNQYLPSKTVISVAGNIQHQDMVTAVSQVMGDWTGNQQSTAYSAYEERPSPPVRVETRDTEQAHLCLALPGLSLFHPGRFTLDLLNVILGEGASSRLFIELRDKQGLTYNIHSHLEHFLDSGSFTVYAGVEPKKLTTAVKSILEQLARLKEPVPESEPSKANKRASLTAYGGQPQCCRLDGGPGNSYRPHP
jgi:predicted Zn-dependent peptidase